MSFELETSLILASVLRARIQPEFSFEKAVPEDDLKFVLNRAANILYAEPIVLDLSPDVVCVGDIHGNLDDLLRIFETCKYPPETKYLFLGDYVDRGKNSVEVAAFLLALKVQFPEHVYLLRGNHETPAINRSYGFYAEVKSKYDDSMFTAFNKTFQYLPMAAIIGSKFICVHGGISPELDDLSDFRKLVKRTEIVGPSVFADIVWSDPSPCTSMFIPNSRGSGVYYGKDALEEFLDANKLDKLIRSHELCQTGYNYPLRTDRIVTIFSNTNYCGRANSAAVMKISKDLESEMIEFLPLSDEELKWRRIIIPTWLAEKNFCSIDQTEDSDISSPFFSENESDLPEFEILK